MKVKAKDHAEALETLRSCFPNGSTVYTIAESVSRSGMSARFRVLSIQPKASTGPDIIWHPNWAASVVTGYALKRGYRDSLQVNGCGFDRAHAIVEALRSALGYNLNHQEL